MRDYVCIGEVPAEEDCAQLGTDGYHERAKKECRAFINQLRRMFGPEPEGARLIVKSNPHDFGNYLDVQCVYDEDDEAATEYAYKCESDMPMTWDDEAKAELAL